MGAEIAGGITRQHVFAVVSSILILFIGFFVARRASSGVARISRLDAQQKLLCQKAIYYALATLTIAMALNQVGFDLKVLLGAAGVLTVAVGFAAQTSASNLISGIFLMADRSFVVGDVVQIGDVIGEIAALDLLSCRIRTFDNRWVRIPNETMVKSTIANLSHFPIRRVDLSLQVAFESSIAATRAALGRAADRCPLILDEPRPVFIFQSFTDAGIAIQFQAWTLRENLGDAQNALFTAVKEELEQARIAIASPRRLVAHAPAREA
jgi:small-conductance mechanosensitive channel